MGADEEGTLAALKSCRRELFDPKLPNIKVICDAHCRRLDPGPRESRLRLSQACDYSETVTVKFR
jgi:hypothetical protein